VFSRNTRDLVSRKNLFFCFVHEREERENQGGDLDSRFNPRFESMFENQTIEYGYDFIDHDD
jgi:hypothetical protein